MSNGVRETFAEDGICPKSKSIVLGAGSATGLDIEFFNPEIVESNVMRTELGVSKDDFVFIFVGCIVADKGINEMVTAFNQLSEEYSHAHLVLIGNEELEQNPITADSRNVIRSNKRIHAIGRRSYVRPWFAASDIFVFPSYREGFPNTVIEAGAMGLASIVTDITGSREIIVQGKNGEIFPSQDTDALYSKMEEWVEHPDKVKEMAANARRMVGDRYEQQMIQLATIAVYRELLREYQG